VRRRYLDKLAAHHLTHDAAAGASHDLHGQAFARSG
jgi:hypothetical protein